MQSRAVPRIARLSSLLAALGLLTLSTLPAFADVSFLGVAAGDASTIKATIWTRAVDSAAPAATALTL